MTSLDDRSRQSLANVLILGGAGFIGTRLADLLCRRSIPFHIGDLRLSARFPEHCSTCDVRRRDSLVPLVRRSSAIFNLAAEHRDDVRPVSRYYETNVEGAKQVCAAAEACGLRKIVFTSSVAVYGSQPGTADENSPFAPSNDYGRSKMAAEEVYRAWAAADPARTLVMVRPTVVFGEGNRGNVYNLMCQLASRRFLMVSDGENIKSMAYVENVAAFLLHCLGCGPGVHVFNYVDGPDLRVKELVAFVRECMRQNGSIRVLPLPMVLAGAHVLDGIARVSGYRFPVSAVRVRKFCANTQFSGARALASGFAPPVTLRDGLQRTIACEFQYAELLGKYPAAVPVQRSVQE